MRLSDRDVDFRIATSTFGSRRRLSNLDVDLRIKRSIFGSLAWGVHRDSIAIAASRSPHHIIHRQIQTDHEIRSPFTIFDHRSRAPLTGHRSPFTVTGHCSPGTVYPSKTQKLPQFTRANTTPLVAPAQAGVQRLCSVSFCVQIPPLASCVRSFWCHSPRANVAQSLTSRGRRLTWFHGLSDWPNRHE